MDAAGLLQELRDAQDCELLTPETSSLKVPAACLFFANAGGKGYYRSAYAPAQYAATCRSRRIAASTPAERISLIGDEWAQVRANKATVGDYLNLVAALKSDSNAEVSLEAPREVLEPSPIKWPRTKKSATRCALDSPQLCARVREARRRLRPTTRPTRASCARELLALLADRGRRRRSCIAQARKIADQYLADPASVDPTLGAGRSRARRGKRRRRAL